MNIQLKEAGVAITALVALAMTVLVGCTTSGYSETLAMNRARAMEYGSNPDLNKFGEEHLKCFICETGSYPTAVSQIVNHRATTASCEPLFNERPIDFLYQRMGDFLITHKKMDDERTLFVITKEGKTFEQVQAKPTAYEFSMMNILHEELEGCGHSD